LRRDDLRRDDLRRDDLRRDDLRRDDLRRENRWSRSNFSDASMILGGAIRGRGRLFPIAACPNCCEG
jgi:uncharacterized protein YjbI with pentapeptide repeats